MKEENKTIEDLFNELITVQEKLKMMQCAKSIVPHVTTHDLLQPNDFPNWKNTFFLGMKKVS